MLIKLMRKSMRKTLARTQLRTYPQKKSVTCFFQNQIGKVPLTAPSKSTKLVLKTRSWYLFYNSVQNFNFLTPTMSDTNYVLGTNFEIFTTQTLSKLPYV